MPGNALATSRRPHFLPDPAHPVSIALAELALRVGAELDGDGNVQIRRVATLQSAEADAIAFLANPRYRAQLASTRAGAVIVAPAMAASTPLPKIVSGNPYATFARVAALLHPPAAVVAGIHPTAVIASNAVVTASASIGPYVSIGAHAVIGQRTAIAAGCAIGSGCHIGDDTRLHPNVTVYADCRIGARSIVHSGVVIGADGFGMAEESGRWLKIPQIGRVIVGNDVEIGANTTIDRGALDDTVIEDDVKLDNQIQIAHNCRVGAHTAIAGCVGIAGSTRIGRNCRIGGAAMISGHLEIADGTTISAASQVFDSIAAPEVYTGTFPALPHREWMHVASAIRRLRTLEARLRTLERAGGRSERPEEREQEQGGK